MQRDLTFLMNKAIKQVITQRYDYNLQIKLDCSINRKT